MTKLWVLVVLLIIPSAALAQHYLGQLGGNPYNSDSTRNPYGGGNPYNPNSITNPFGQYGSRYSPNSATNPYATDAPKLFNGGGSYRGKLSANPYDPDSVSNPYGRFGNPYSPDSINNPYGAGLTTSVIDLEYRVQDGQGWGMWQRATPHTNWMSGYTTWLGQAITAKYLSGSAEGF